MDFSRGNNPFAFEVYLCEELMAMKAMVEGLYHEINKVDGSGPLVKVRWGSYLPKTSPSPSSYLSPYSSSSSSRETYSSK